MTDTTTGQGWEVYLPQQKQWARVVVVKVQDGSVTLRYEGTLEMLTVKLDDMQDSERFRLATADPS